MNDVIYVKSKDEFIHKYYELIINELNGRLKVNGKRFYSLDLSNINELLNDLDNIMSLEFFIEGNGKYTKLVYMVFEFNH